MQHFDAALLGIGGCPFAPGAAGNFSTAKLVAEMHGETIVDAEALKAAELSLDDILG